MSCSNKQDLAIVIPAFKSKFLAATLESIAAQTCHSFHVYIGDDNSQENLFEIIRLYSDRLPLTYQRFSENLGGKSVVSHWHRCVEMTGEEPWIWLFSDDDIMTPDCVANFYTALEDVGENFDLFRLNCAIIDSENKPLTGHSNYPLLQSSAEFIKARFAYQYHSYLVNYIFSRKVYNRNKGFVELPAAWGSDDATWILYGQEKGIYTVPRGVVHWRQSSYNISGNRTDARNRRQKYRGTTQFLKWAYQWAKQHKVEIDDQLVLHWYLTLLRSLGFRNRFWPYLLGKPFRRHFWKKNRRLQVHFLAKECFLR